MERCFACQKKIWFFQKTGFNFSWHKKCTEVWEKGYYTAWKFCVNENEIHGYPTPGELYSRRGSLGEILPENQWKKRGATP